MGPGLIYLLMLSVLVTLLFPPHIAYWTIGLNLILCLGGGAAISLKLLTSPLIIECSLGTWIAISSNLVFLSFLCVVIIGNTISTLESTINAKFLLKNKLALISADVLCRNELIKEAEIHLVIKKT